MAKNTAAAPQTTQLTLPDVNRHLAGQKNINGQLCKVDWMLIEALNQVATALEQRGDKLPALRDLLINADRLSAEVANEDPPGCNPKKRSG
jgi:hypothetical protein